MTVAELVAEVRRLAADPVGYPAAPDGGGQADDPQPRWPRADILRVANGVLAELSGSAPRLFMMGCSYGMPSAAPVLADDDGASLAEVGLAPLVVALPCLVAAELLGDVMDKGAVEQAQALRKRAAEALEGYGSGS